MPTYFLQRSTGGAIKIGKGKDVRKRIRGLQTAHDVPLVTLATSDIPEARIHRKFAKLRIRGEWFRLNDELFNYMRRLQPAGAPTIVTEELVDRSQVSCKDLIWRVGDRIYDLEECDDPYQWYQGHQWDNPVPPWADECQYEVASDAEDEDCDDECDSVIEIVDNMSSVIFDEPFFEKIAVSESENIVVFQCGALNSGRRWQLIRELASLAEEADQISGSWTFWAQFVDTGNNRIGVRLAHLGRFYYYERSPIAGHLPLDVLYDLCFFNPSGPLPSLDGPDSFEGAAFLDGSSR